MDLPLQFAIAFFGVQVAAWAVLIFYIRAARQRRVENALADMVAEAQQDTMARAA